MAKSKPLAMHLSHIAGKTEDGRDVYHCLRWCKRIRREFWFTLMPAGVSGESRNDSRWQFDARELPTKYLPDVQKSNLDVSEFWLGTTPIDWVLAALNDGWESPDEPRIQRETPDGNELPF
jgi:hypothetical protein